MAQQLEIKALPKKTRYCDGEEIKLDGLVFELEGRDVTDEVALEWTPDVTGWPRGRKRIYVKAHLGDEHATIELRRKQSPYVFIIIALLAVAAAFGIAMWRMSYEPESLQGGSKIEAQGDRSEREVQAALDVRAEESLMTVNMAPELQLDSEGRVRVAFIVENEEDSGEGHAFPQRLELIQNDRKIFRSGTVMPGYAIEWAETDGAHIGGVTAMVYRVDAETGADVGSPVAVELDIVDAD